jgi:hypothetical protein
MPPGSNAGSSTTGIWETAVTTCLPYRAVLSD